MIGRGFFGTVPVLGGTICAILCSCISSQEQEERLAHAQGAAIGAVIGGSAGFATGGVYWSESKTHQRLLDKQRRLEMLEKERSKPSKPGAVPDPKELKTPAKDY